MHQTTLATDTAGAGMLSAYALDAGRRLIALRSQLPLISADAPTAWVHVAYEGQWEGHGSGPFEFTRAVFEQVIANFERQTNSVKLDFDHETVFTDGPTPARGWIHQLELRKRKKSPYGVSLWALVEFGAEATAINRSGGYKFCSGVFEFDAVDRVTGDECGCEMTSLALTDSPFIDGQRPIQLSRRASATGGEDMKIKKDLIRALNVVKKDTLVEVLDQIEGDEVTAEQLTKAAEFAAAKDGTLEEAPMADDTALQDEDEEDEEKSLAADDEEDEDKKPLADELPLQDPDADAALAAIAPLMEATGLDIVAVAAAISENLDQVAAALGGALQEPAADAPLGAQPPGLPGGGGAPGDAALSLSVTQTALGAVTKERDKLLTRVEGIEAREADEAVSAYVESGYILDIAKPKMVALYRQDRDGFNQIVACMKPAVEVGERTPKPPKQKELPAISEADLEDPDIKALHRSLKATRSLTPAQIDKTIREQVAARKETRV